MTYRFVDAERASHAIAMLCRVLRVSRSGFYAWLSRSVSDRDIADGLLGALIDQIHAESDGTYGVPRIHADLRRRGVRVSRRRVSRLMRQQGLEGVSRRKRRRTTVRDERKPKAPDLVGRDFFAVEGPNRLWLADITYVPTWEGFLYLAIVEDTWSRKIIGWAMRSTLEAELVVDAVGMAITARRPDPGVIHHSDAGSQYSSTVFGRTLRDSGILQSMGTVGDPYDNAACESAIATIKTELVHRRSFHTRDQARLGVFHYIEAWYNPRRIHSSLGYQTPIEYEETHQERKPETVH